MSIRGRLKDCGIYPALALVAHHKRFKTSTRGRRLPGIMPPILATAGDDSDLQAHLCYSSKFKELIGKKHNLQHMQPSNLSLPKLEKA